MAFMNVFAHASLLSLYRSKLRGILPSVIKNTTQSFWKRRKPLSDEQTIKILTKDLNKYLIQIQTDYDPNLAASIRNLLPEIQSSYGLYMYGLDPESSEFSRIYKES